MPSSTTFGAYNYLVEAKTKWRKMEKGQKPKAWEEGRKKEKKETKETD